MTRRHIIGTAHTQPRVIAHEADWRGRFHKRQKIRACNGSVSTVNIVISDTSTIKHCRDGNNYRGHHKFSPYGMDQNRLRKGLAQPQAWHAGTDCELAGVSPSDTPCLKFECTHTQESIWRKHTNIGHQRYHSRYRGEGCNWHSVRNELKRVIML